MRQHLTGRLLNKLISEQKIIDLIDELASVHNIEKHVQRIAIQGEESRTLAALRDMLLPKLLSGEVSVSGAAKELSG